MKAFPLSARRILLAHIVSFGAHSFMVAVMGSPLIGLFVGGITVVPAILYLKKHRYGAFVFRSTLIITILQWPLAVFAAHEVDRTPLFWCLWIYFGVLIIADAIVAFRKWDYTPLETSPTNQSSERAQPPVAD